MTSSSSEPLHILGLKVSNLMKIRAVEIRPTPEGLTVVSGEMGAGKSSVLAAIEMAFRGKDAVPQQPIRAGEESARIDIDVGPDGVPAFTVTRKFTGQNTYLEVRTPDGAKISSPQQMLNDLMTAISFDPLAFMNPPGCKTDATRRAARSEMLLSLVNLSIDLKAHDKLRAEVAAERAAANKEAERLANLQKDMTSEPGASVADVSEEEDETPLVTEVALMEREVQDTAAASKRVIELDNEIQRLRAEIDRVVAERQKQFMLSTRKASDVAPVKARLEDMRKKNALRRKCREDGIRRDETLKQLGDARDRAAKLSKRLQELDDIRGKALSDATFPVKAMSVSADGDVTIKTKDGHVLPFDQASHGQQMLASFAVMASKSPRLRVALVREGNNLSVAGMHQLASMAHKFGFQCWVERIVADQPGSIIIEDGSVAAPAVT